MLIYRRTVVSINEYAYDQFQGLSSLRDHNQLRQVTSTGQQQNEGVCAPLEPPALNKGTMQ